MVVHEHAAGRGHADQRAKHFAGVDLDVVHAAARDLDDIEQAVADVDADHEEDFLRHAGQARRDAAIDVLGRRAVARWCSISTARRPSSKAAAIRAARAAPTPVTSASSRGEARESATTLPERTTSRSLSDVPSPSRADAGAEDDRDQLLVADLVGGLGPTIVRADVPR